ncbi:MAG: hypothetical protein IPK05_19705 [Comamonadaceae bacterium]|nr:hypothetical protein [Comamonadaceae bacterium]
MRQTGHAQRRKSYSASRCRASTNAATVVTDDSGTSSPSAQAALPKGVELKAVADRTEIVDEALKTSATRA